MQRDRQQLHRDFMAAVAAMDGIFTARMASTYGINSADLRAGIGLGTWRHYRYRGIYQLTGAADTWRTALRVALLRTDYPAVATGPSALRLWRFDLPATSWPGDRPYIQVPPQAHLHLDDVEILREARQTCRTIDGIDTVERDKAIVDTLRLLAPTDARPVLYRALQTRWIDVPRLEWWADRLKRKRGSRILKQHLEDARCGTHAESERVAAKLLRAAKIGGWQANCPIYDHDGLIGYGDFVFPVPRLVVEVDGRAWHSSPERFQTDRTRQNRLIQAGWKVLRFTWQDLTDSPNSVVRQISAVVR